VANIRDYKEEGKDGAMDKEKLILFMKAVSVAG
jgi:hypothetical protein